MNRAASRTLTILVLLVLVAVPLAAAQAPGGASATTTEVSIRGFDGAVANGTEATTPVEVTYCYQPQGVSNEPTTVEVSVNESPAWADASVSPSSLTFHEGQAAGSTDGQTCESGTTNLTVAVAANAAAGTEGKVTVVAEAQQNGPFLAPSRGESAVAVEVAGSSSAEGNGTGSVNATGSASARGAGDAGSNGVPAPHAPLVAASLVGAAVLVRRRYGGGSGQT